MTARTYLPLYLLVLAAGCLPPVPVAKREASSETPDKPSGVEVPPSTLPGLDEPLQLDDTGLMASPPIGWVRENAGLSKARFKPPGETDYPYIAIEVGTGPGFDAVTAENKQAFAKHVHANIAENVGKKGAEKVTPVSFQDFHGAAHRRSARIKSEGKDDLFVDRLMIDTVLKGQMYTVELWAVQGTLDTYVPQAYAVAASLNFDPPPAPDAKTDLAPDKPKDDKK